MLLNLLKFLLYLALVVGAIVGVQHFRNSGKKPLPPNDPETLRIATYNVHYIIVRQDTGPWSLGDWDRRKGPLDQAFKEIDADVIAFQEMESFAGRGQNGLNLTLDWLLENNTDYAAAAVGPPDAFPSTQPILYRRDVFEVESQGWFFFSETPDVIYSRTFNGSFPAFASWAELKNKASGQLFRVINIHTDFRSRSNRLQSMALVAERIKPWVDADEDIFVVGDFNARHGAETLRIVSDTGMTFAPVAGSTYHLNRGLNLFGAIDHVGYNGSMTVAAGPFVLRDKFDDEWPTDHYPVVVDFRSSGIDDQ